MAFNKTAVFIASRFGEFAELREHLRRRIAEYPKLNMAPVDLNDGSVSSRPPLNVCLGHVRQAEFMILLMGETYGGLAPGKDKSFTHLEYEEAIHEDSDTHVLVFGIGPSYANGQITWSSDPKLAAWQQQVEPNHTMGFLDFTDSSDVLAKQILDHLLTALYEIHFGQVFLDEDDEEDLDQEADGSALSNDEVESLEAIRRRQRGENVEADEISGLEQSLANPARLAAMEQCREARRAIDVGLLSVAMEHYRRAIELRPLDGEANYWLSRLYLLTGQRRYLPEVKRMLERTAKIASNQGETYRASDCYQLLARASQSGGDHEEARRYAKMACDIEPRFGRAYYENARILMQQGKKAAALSALGKAIQRFFRITVEARRDPVFRPIRSEIKERTNAELKKLSNRVDSVIENELQISRALTGNDAILSPPTITNRGQALRLIETSIESQRASIGQLIQMAQRAHADAELIEGNNLSDVEQTHGFRPERASFFLLSRWHKDAGDTLNTGDIVCELLIGQNAARFMLRWNKPAAQLFQQHVAAGTSLNAGDGGRLFTSVPVGWKQVRMSRHAELALERTRIKQDLEHLRSQHREEMAQAAIAFRSRLLFGALPLAIGLMMLVSDTLHGLAMILLIVAIPVMASATTIKRNVPSPQPPDRLDDIEKAIQSLIGSADSAKQRLQEALAAWQKTLSTPWVQRQFCTLDRLQPGRILIASMHQIKDAQAHSQLKCTVGVVFSSVPENQSRIFRVRSNSDGSILLSEAAAYQGSA